ncbi:hypothetical protein [Thiorhodococcus minor]|uniref:DUF4148 domain-containing protein n=1 Tax=Thiorhodococcus minor TaxID=57489 RepID=A0A6M0K559_9GAMM|nr:hypothetical protein [Thiorhodococcus minor]NEV64394.1 hypothetical protein [Thiorhodococcus minor]
MTKSLATLAIALTISLAPSLAVLAQDETYPNEVDTHIGRLTFDHGVPTEETSEKLYYERVQPAERARSAYTKL